MAKQPTCLVCQKVMVRGFLTERGSGGGATNLPRWCVGEPERPALLPRGEVTAAQTTAGLPVVAYRCPECEALRLYAPSQE